MAAAGKGKYGWKNEVEILSSGRWTRLTEFRSTIDQVRCMNLSIQVNKDAAIQLLANMRVEPPFSEEKRFPDPGVYVYLNSSYIAPRLSKIVNTLSVHDRDKTTNPNMAVSDAVQVQKYRATQDAGLSLYHVLNELGMLTSGVEDVEKLHSKGVFTRDTFEKRFVLTWTPTT